MRDYNMGRLDYDDFDDERNYIGPKRIKQGDYMVRQKYDYICPKCGFNSRSLNDVLEHKAREHKK